MGCIEPFVIDDDDGWCRQHCGRCGRPLTDPAGALNIWPETASPQPVTLCKICSRRVLSTD